MSPRLLILAAFACLVALWPAGVFAGADRVKEMQAIATAKWGPVCGGQPVQVIRGRLPKDTLAHATWRFPLATPDDPSTYSDCKITYRAGHISWPVFCSAGVHEYGHLAHWRAKPGREYVHVDAQGRETHDFAHSADPASIMHPTQETIWPACRNHKPPPAARPPAPTASSAPTVPTVLLLPGGGWQHADPDTMAPWAWDFARHGIRARAITYPLRDVPAAIRYVAQVAAREPGPVIAYGISAGGTIAAALAATGQIAGAVNIAGPTDFTRWMSPFGSPIMAQIGMRSYAQKRTASPYWMLNGRQVPQLIQCGLADPLVEWTQCARYAHAAHLGQRDTRLDAMANAHAQSSLDRDRARAWIAARWPTP